jgi:hypothetical protein
VQQGLDPVIYATADVRSSVIAGSISAGLSVYSSTVTMADSAIRRTVPLMSTQLFGDGVSVSVSDPTFPGWVRLERCAVEASERAGAASFGATLSVSQTHFDCNDIDLTGQSVAALDFTFEDLGGNVCSCAGEDRACQLASATLEAPEPANPSPDPSQ